jgi:hypothetical protein
MCVGLQQQLPHFFSPVEFTVSADEAPSDPEREAERAEKADTDKTADAIADADKKADAEADAEVDAEKKADADEEVNSNKDRRNQGDNTQATFNMIDGGIAANNPVGFSSVGPIKKIYMHQLSQSGISSLVLSFISI